MGDSASVRPRARCGRQEGPLGLRPTPGSQEGMDRASGGVCRAGALSSLQPDLSTPRAAPHWTDL